MEKPTPGKTRKAPLEYIEQESIFRWARANQIRWPDLQLLNASLNGVRLSAPKLRVAMKKQGMRKGFPDINLPVTTQEYAGLYIELKRVRGGSVSREQKEWLHRLNAQRYKAVVCKGHEEAIKTIMDYLGIGEEAGE